VLFHHDSSAAPQTLQTASPVCGTKNFASVRSYSAPQLHRTIVAIPRICAPARPFSSPEVRHNQTDPLPLAGVPIYRADRNASAGTTSHPTITKDVTAPAAI
jgi:hypothetical protein